MKSEYVGNMYSQCHENLRLLNKKSLIDEFIYGLIDQVHHHHHHHHHPLYHHHHHHHHHLIIIKSYLSKNNEIIRIEMVQLDYLRLKG